MTRPYVDQMAYRRSHARGPRGRACWAFAYLSADRAELGREWFPGPFTEARRKAIAKATDFPGCYCIEVLP